MKRTATTAGHSAVKALIAMSGGVDSSVAALLTKQAGSECVGVTMKLFDGEPGEDSRCCTLDDAEDARAVAYKMGIPFYVFNFKKEFQTGIIQRFADYYLSGKTPNPCIDCNRFMKFGKLFDRARELGCDFVVTGHYARVESDPESGKYLLKRAADPAKDQSYVLYSLTQEQLAHVRFPLGGLTKDEVRRIASENGFVTAHKPDSQDICFVPDGDVLGAVQRFSGVEAVPGDFIDKNGKVLGKHKGFFKYTVGQRKGLGIAAEKPLYVCAIDPAANTVTLGGSEELFSSRAVVSDVNWISGEAPSGAIRCGVRIRYHAPVAPACVTPLPGGGAEVSFDSPQRAITPGQAAVFYSGDTVLGGGELM